MAELFEYDVPNRNSTMRVKLSAEDAELLYGDQAKKVGDVKQAEPQPVRSQPWAEPVPEPGESEVKQQSEKKAPPARNKARSGDTDKA